MRKSLLSVFGIVLLLLIVVFLNGASKNVFRSWYLDLTEEGLYSLSYGSKRILGSLEEPIRLRFYFSKTDAASFPGLKIYGERVENFLREYERHGGGNIILEQYDPRPDSDEEGWAQKYGLQPMSLPTGERLFLGLVGMGESGKEQVLPVFNLTRQEFLEYDITKLIYALSEPEKPIVGIISSLNLNGTPVPGANPMQAPPRPWAFVEPLRDFAVLKFLGSDPKTIAEPVDMLLVVHPKQLSPSTLYAIDQFVLQGGKLLALVDPYCEADVPAGDPQNAMARLAAPRNSTLNALTEKWGVKLLEGQVAVDMTLSAKVNSGRGGPPLDFPVWIELTRKNMASDDVITGALESVLVAWSGALELSESGEASVQPIFETTEDSSLIPDNQVRFGGGNPRNLVRQFQRGGKKLVLGARINGTLETNFPKGDPEKSAEGADESAQMSVMPTHLLKSSSSSHVVIVADVDFASDRFSVVEQNFFGTILRTLLNDNLFFVQNAVENLSGSEDLVSIRSRGRFARPFTRVQAIERAAQKRWMLEEKKFEAQLNAANRRLTELQAGTQSSGERKAILSDAVLEEMKQLRDERRQAQARLREVRRNLRQDKERLGNWLFMLNTFFVPLVLIVIATGAYYMKGRKRTRKEETHDE